MFNLRSYSSPNNNGSEIVTLPATILQKEIGKVCYRKTDNDEIEVICTILNEKPGEGWLTGIALDASFSLRADYGRSLSGEIPKSLINKYWKKGWVKVEKRDGLERCYYKREVYEDALKNNVLRYTDNRMEPIARNFITYLSDIVDATGKTHVIYWACGDGTEYEVLGSFLPEHWETKSIIGPVIKDFGLKSHLLPAIKYFDSRFKDAPTGLFVILTDGSIDDMQQVKDFSIGLARKIEVGKRNPVKFVLIGIGPDIDDTHLRELDNLKTGTDVDLWDYQPVRDMRGINDIFAELADSSQLVAPRGTIIDDKGKSVQTFTDGFPAKVSFRLPSDSSYFEIKVREKTVRQLLASSN